jgi:hypothetical protein
MSRVKWLNKLEDKENLGILTRFKKRYIKGCYDIVIIKYFLTDEPYTLT